MWPLLGQAAELRRKDVDLKHSQIRVERAVYPIHGEYPVQTPRSRAGVRTIVLPEFVTELLREHMRDYSPIGPDGLLFPTRSGLCAYNAIQIAISRTLRAMGYENVRVHDLRHSGQLLAAPLGPTACCDERRDADGPPAAHGSFDSQCGNGLRTRLARQRAKHGRAHECATSDGC